MIDEKSAAEALSFLIKKQRKALNMTQEQLAQKTGLSTRHIGKLEDGTYMPKFITYLKLSEVLKFDLSDVLTISKHTTNENEAKILELLKNMSSEDVLTSLKMLEILSQRRADQHA